MPTPDIEVIDTHCHVEPWFMGLGSRPSERRGASGSPGGEKPERGWFKDLFAQCRHRTRLCVSGTGQNPALVGNGNVVAMKTLARLLSPWPEKFILSVMVDANDGPGSLEAIETGVKKFGYKCVGELVQYIHRWRTDGREALPIMQKAIDLDVPLMFHSSAEDHAEGVERLAEKFPRARIIIAHAAGGRAWRRGIQCIRRCPNVLVEIMEGNREQLEVLLDAVGPRRITFGTDFGVHQGPELRYTAGNWLLDAMDSLGLTASDQDRIAGANAREALRLGEARL